MRLAEKMHLFLKVDGIYKEYILKCHSRFSYQTSFLWLEMEVKHKGFLRISALEKSHKWTHNL